VEPRFGRLYSTAVLRPLAEQLVDQLDVRPGASACDVLCDSGTLGVTLGAAVGASGRVLLVDTDASLLRTAAIDVARAGSAVETSPVQQSALPLGDASCDRVGSLCTFGFWPGGSMMDEALRITRRDGVAALLTWDPDDPPPHERALATALRDVTGTPSRFLTECIAAPVRAQHAGWERDLLRDVVRFDGMAQYWAAMVLERPALAQLRDAPAATVIAVRDACERSLQRCIAADGTIRIPVTAIMWRRRGAA
jgi:SAM-dependent methyltransferase